MSNIYEASSGSLVIAQGQQELNINSSDQKTKNDDDLFELSRDQPSLSFQIEQERKLNKIKQLCRRSKDDTLQLKIVDQPQQQNKRKRKQIFDKFKKKEHTTINKTEEGNTSQNLLNIFDSIFNKKGINPAQICGVYDASSRFDQNKPILQGISMRSRTPSAEKRSRQRIFEKKTNNAMFGTVLPSNILDEEEKQKQQRITKDSPNRQNNLPLSYLSPVRPDRSDQQIDLESVEKKISLIQPLEDDERDSFEINNILESAIFRDENESPRRFEPTMERLIEKANVEPIDDKEPDMKNQPTTFSVPKDDEIFKKRQAVVEPLLAERKSGFSNMSSVKGLQSNRSSVSLYQAGSNSPMQETKYIINNNNDLSSISSSPSVLVQDYNSRKLQLNVSNSMANIPHRNYEQMSTPRVMEMNVKPAYLDNSNIDQLVESKIIKPIERINIIHQFEEQARLPAFLRKVRKHISVYPNFYIMSNSPNTPQTISYEFYQMLQQVDKAIKFLQSMCQIVASKKHKKQLYISKIMNNLSVDSFIKDNWEDIMNFEDYDLIKPVEPIEVRVWNYDKAKTALSNYQNVVKHYANKGLKLDYSTDKGRKKYFDIRQKFWDICGNMKLISQDIFCEIRNCMFPSHYIKFKKFLESPFPGRLTQSRLDQVKKLTTLFRYLRSQNDALAHSSIGSKINEKLQLQTYYLLPY